MRKLKSPGRQPVLLFPSVMAYSASLRKLGNSFFYMNNVTFDANSLFAYTTRRYTASQFRSLQLTLLLSIEIEAVLFPELLNDLA